MLIKVELTDGYCVHVSPEGLTRLLEHNRVKCFERNNGWAVVGLHPMRRYQSLNGCYGLERRNRVAVGA